MIFEATVNQNIQIAVDVWEITLDINADRFYFNSGQYVWVILKSGRRAFSISSSSSNPSIIKIIYKKINSDYVRDLLSLRKDDKTKITDARGVLRIPSENSNTIYVAGGVGVSPFISILRTLYDKNINRKITLIFANKSEDHVFLLDELKRFKEINNNFDLVMVNGKVSKEIIEKIATKNPDGDWKVIGSQSFVDFANKLLGDLNIPSNKISFEQNYPIQPKIVDINEQSFYRNICDLVNTHIIITDPNGIVLYSNNAATVMTGYTFDEMKGQTPRLWGGLMDPELYKEMWHKIKVLGEDFSGDLTNIKKDGTKYIARAVIKPIFSPEKKLIGFIGIEEDITDYKKTQDELAKLNDLLVKQNIK